MNLLAHEKVLLLNNIEVIISVKNIVALHAPGQITAGATIVRCNLCLRDGWRSHFNGTLQLCLALCVRCEASSFILQLSRFQPLKTIFDGIQKKEKRRAKILKIAQKNSPQCYYGLVHQSPVLCIPIKYKTYV